MTLEEKCYLLSGKDFWQTRSVERLGVPSMTLSDGPHGIRKQALTLSPGPRITPTPWLAASSPRWAPISSPRAGS